MQNTPNIDEKKFVCEHCGEEYTMSELPNYDGECAECGADIPKNEEAYKKELDEMITAMAFSGNEDCNSLR